MKLGFLSLLLALGVAFFSAFQFENYQKFVVETQASLTQLAEADRQIKPELSQLAARLADLKQEDHWKIAEASYLIRLASQQWQFSPDVAITSRLLAAADEALQALQDPRWMGARESLKQDQLALEAVKLPDKEGLWLTVTALINKVPELPTRNVRRQMSGEEASAGSLPALSQNTDTEKPGWKMELQRNLQRFKDLVKIQQHSKPIEPILSESQQALAQETLRLLLEQLRWSILHGNVAVYQTSLQQSVEWLKTYFELSNDQVKQVETTLAELSTVELRPKLPEIGTALPLLQNTR